MGCCYISIADPENRKQTGAATPLPKVPFTPSDLTLAELRARSANATQLVTVAWGNFP